MAKTDLTAARLRELLNYDPETGLFAWRVFIGCGHGRKQVKRNVGDRAGYVNQDGYVMIGIEGREYRAHRLAWLHMSGEWPSNLIDHINCCKSDNRIENLRVADKSINSQNIKKAPSHSKTGLLGAAYHAFSGLWLSRIQLRGKVYGLGYYATPEEAHAAYLAAKRRLHEGCTI